MPVTTEISGRTIWQSVFISPTRLAPASAIKICVSAFISFIDRQIPIGVLKDFGVATVYNRLSEVRTDSVW